MVTIGHLTSGNDALKERLILRTEQVEDYKERARVIDRQVKVVGTDPRNKALALVTRLRDFIEESNVAESATRDNNNVDEHRCSTGDTAPLRCGCVQ